MVGRVRMRKITNDEGSRLLSTVQWAASAVVTWQYA